MCLSDLPIYTFSALLDICSPAGVVKQAVLNSADILSSDAARQQNRLHCRALADSLLSRACSNCLATIAHAQRHW